MTFVVNFGETGSYASAIRSVVRFNITRTQDRIDNDW